MGHPDRAGLRPGRRPGRPGRAEPEIRRFGSAQVPYWESGEAFLPYGKNYYSTAMLQTSYQHTIEGSAGFLG